MIEFRFDSIAANRLKLISWNRLQNEPTVILSEAEGP
jgi:hypothetical protein